MPAYEDKNVLNGTFGEVWVGSEYIDEIIGAEWKMKLDTSPVTRVGTLGKGSKVTGMSGSGTLKCNKTRSFFLNLILTAINEGRTATATVIINQADPDAWGSERVQLNNCVFTEIGGGFDAGKLGEESIPFEFESVTPLETIDA